MFYVNTQTYTLPISYDTNGYKICVMSNYNDGTIQEVNTNRILQAGSKKSSSFQYKASLNCYCDMFVVGF